MPLRTRLRLVFPVSFAFLPVACVVFSNYRFIISMVQGASRTGMMRKSGTRAGIMDTVLNFADFYDIIAS